MTTKSGNICNAFYLLDCQVTCEEKQEGETPSSLVVRVDETWYQTTIVLEDERTFTFDNDEFKHENLSQHGKHRIVCLDGRKIVVDSPFSYVRSSKHSMEISNVFAGRMLFCDPYDSKTHYGLDEIDYYVDGKEGKLDSCFLVEWNCRTSAPRQPKTKMPVFLRLPSMRKKHSQVLPEAWLMDDIGKTRTVFSFTGLVPGMEYSRMHVKFANVDFLLVCVSHAQFHLLSVEYTGELKRRLLEEANIDVNELPVEVVTADMEVVTVLPESATCKSYAKSVADARGVGDSSSSSGDSPHGFVIVDFTTSFF